MTAPVYAIPKRSKRNTEDAIGKKEDEPEVTVEFQRLFDRAMGREDAEQKE